MNGGIAIRGDTSCVGRAENINKHRFAAKHTVGIIVASLLGIHAGLLAWSACVHSPNANETSHIAAGICHWQLQRFDLYRVNPPLIRLIAAVPVIIAGTETNWSKLDDSPRFRPEFRVGPDWVAANGERSLWLMTLARWACIPFSLVGGLVCFLWARDLYGAVAGLTACALWCFSPNILGHASCITPDAHATAMGLAANYLFWKWLNNPTWGRAGIVGVLLGITLLTKTTWIVLLFVWPIQFCCWTWLSGRLVGVRTSLPARTAQLGMVLLLGLHVLNFGYVYGGAFDRLGDFTFISSSLSGRTDGREGNRFRGTALACVPVPLPAEYVLGIDAQKQDHERHPVMYYHGETHDRGVWYFYLYALGIKVPSGVWLLALTAVAMKFKSSERVGSVLDEFVLVTPLAVILVLASCETDYTTHFRYVLPIIPYALIWVSQVGKALSRLSCWTSFVLTGLMWSVGSSLWYSPHWLSYFNEFAGGPANGHRRLANSNLDWGQDLLFLRRWLEAHPDVNPIGLAYYGMFHPRDIGIRFTDVPSGGFDPENSARNQPTATGPNSRLRPGWYAVSVNFVVGHPFWDYRADGTRNWFGQEHFRWLKGLEPVSRAGYSILIYHVTDEDIRRLTSRIEDHPLPDQSPSRSFDLDGR